MDTTAFMMRGIWDEIFIVEINQVPGEHKVELRPITVLKNYHSHREGKDLVLRGLCAFNEAISQV
jgi:hypothetical protein